MDGYECKANQRPPAEEVEERTRKCGILWDTYMGYNIKQQMQKQNA